MGQLLHKRKWSHDELQWVQRVKSSNSEFRVLPRMLLIHSITGTRVMVGHTALQHEFGIFFLLSIQT